jgi:hypothetical protein
MKNQIRILLYFLFSVYGLFSQNLVPNLGTYLTSVTGPISSNSSVFFDNNNQTPLQLREGIRSCVSNGGRTIVNCNRRYGELGSGTTFTFDLSSTKKITSISLNNLMAPYWWLETSTSFSYRLTSPRFQILTSSSSLGPWNIIKDTTITITAPTAVNLNISLNKISRFWKIQILNAPDINVGCCADNLRAERPLTLTEIQFFEDANLISSTNPSPLIDGQCTQLTAAVSGETYLWSTGETTQSINVCNSGTYTVQVTNTSFKGNQDHTASISVTTLGQQDNLHSPNGEVYSIYKQGNTVYYGGDFNAVGPSTGSGAKINLNNAQPNTNLPRIVGTINVTIPDGAGGWFVGGNFSRIGNYDIKNLAHIKSDNSVDLNFKPQPNNTVFSLLLNGSYLYAGGQFTTVKDLTNNYLVKIDKTTGEPIFWNAFANNIVRTIQFYDDKMIVGGEFTSIGGQTRNRLAALDTTFVQATSWNPNVNGTVHKVYVANNKLYIGGAFTTISGVNKSRGAGYSLPAFSLDGYDFGANNTILDFKLHNNIL